MSSLSTPLAIFAAACLLLGFSACEDGSVRPGMTLIPGGEFILGISPDRILPDFLSDRTASLNAQPQQSLSVPAFYIDRHEVTYEEFLRFKPQAAYADGHPREPIRGVSWYEADAYCLWAGKRLPTEFEWEKAARGSDGRLFVWGNDFSRDNANLGKSVKNVGSQEGDKSVYGVYDMNGNVSEWTASAYSPYPNSAHADPNYGNKLKVIRGGAFQKSEHGFSKEFAMLPYRNFAPPEIRTWDTGFRCAANADKR